MYGEFWEDNLIFFILENVDSSLLGKHIVVVGHTIMLGWEMPYKNIFFAYSAFIMGTLKGSTRQFFNFSAQSQNFIGG